MLTFDDKGGWGGQKNPKTCLRNTWMFPKQKVPVMNYSMLCDTQLSGELFGPSEKYKKLSHPIIICIFYLI